MAKTIIAAKEMEIPVVFHNYKLLKDKSFVLKGSNIYFVQGPNGVGKTSFLKALESAQIAKDDTETKVSLGEDEGFYEFTIPSATGESITIRNEFTNTGSKFIAIRGDGTKVSNVTDIRKLFNYTPLNVKEFFAMSEYAEGRRKQRDIILKLLPDDQIAKFNDLDLQEQHYYNERTGINTALKTANQFASVQATPEEVEMVKREAEARELLKKYQELGTVFGSINMNETWKNKISLEITELERSLETKRTQLKEITEKIDNLKLQTGDLTIEEVSQRVEKGNLVIQRIADIKARVNLGEENNTIRIDLQKKSEELDKKITDARIEKTRIIEESDLPVNNISFEDGYLKIDGFVFKDNQICESDAVLLLANILAKINPGPIQVIGDASILDNEKLEKLNEIAERNNKVMFVDEVVRDASEMVVVGYEDIMKEELKSKLEKVEKKTKKSKYPTLDSIDADIKIVPIVDEQVTDSTGPDVDPTKKDLLF